VNKPKQRFEQRRAARRQSDSGSVVAPKSPVPQDASASPPGLGARRLAVNMIETVVRERRPLARLSSDADGTVDTGAMEPRDRAFAHLMAMTVLRRYGTLSAVLDRFIERPLPDAGARARTIMLVGAAQILLLGTPVHAAVDLAVEQCRRQRSAAPYAKLANAVMRRVAKEGPAIFATLDSAALDVPAWMYRRWATTYGDARARQIATASLVEAPLDLSVKRDADTWAEKLGGRVLATGSVRLGEHARVDALPGYAEGAWWVQDAAAALPVRLLGNVAGLRVADLCAAPGGKSAALAAAGARVTAVDVSAQRLDVVRRNMARLGLSDAVDIIAADIETWTSAEPFDAVLLDAPCSATGTIRRHPDILHLKRFDDIARSAVVESRLLSRMAGLVKPGGVLVYCTCSLEPEEGEQRVAQFLTEHTDFAREPVVPSDVAGHAEWITSSGDLRTFPFQNPAVGETDSGGMDGFYAARLRRRRT
jgi:16S rRNA (cytosine967-C5)-methyltransferase